jgi:hypothetical protein
MTNAVANPVVTAAETYLRGLRDKDLSRVPFAEGVTLESPLTPKITGPAAVTAFVSGLFPAIKDVRITRRIVEGEYIAVMFDLDTVFGVIPVFDCIRVSGGLIEEIRPYYDPRPITDGAVK